MPAGARAALEILRGSDGDALRDTRHATRLRSLVARAVGAATTAIAPIVIGDDRAAIRDMEVWYREVRQCGRAAVRVGVPGMWYARGVLGPLRLVRCVVLTLAVSV